MTPPSRQKQETRKNPLVAARPDKRDRRAARPGISAVPGWIGNLLTWIAVGLVVFFLTYRFVADPDTWFHLKLGQYIEQTGELPKTDPFSHTAINGKYVPSGWMTSVLMNKLDQLYPESSLWLILMVTFVIGFASIVILARAARAGTTIATGLVLMAGLCMAVVRFSPRPDIFSLLGLTLLLWILTADWFRPSQRMKRRARTDDGPQAPDLYLLWVLPVLVVAWANLHAGVLIAIPFLLTYGVWLVIRWRKTGNDDWAMAALPVAIACVIWQLNPYGPGLADLAWRISSIPDVGWVMEWMPFFKANFAMVWPVYVFAAFIIGISIWIVVGNWQKMHPLEILWLVVLVVLAMMQRRQLGLLAFGAPLILARHLVPMEMWLRRGMAVRGMAATAVFAAAIMFIQYSGANGNGGGKPRMGRNCSALPCVTADFLVENPPPQSIFNSYNMGGYLLYKLHPATKVFIDGRLDVYPHQVWQDMLAVEENRLPVDELIKRYKIETFVIGIADSFNDAGHLASRLAARKDMALVHFDDVAAVFVRVTAQNIDYVNRLGLPSVTPWNIPQMAQTIANPANQQQVINDVGRLLRQSNQAASVCALAGYVAWIAGDNETMNEQLGWAELKQPGNGLLRLVKDRIARAEAAVAERGRQNQAR